MGRNATETDRRDDLGREVRVSLLPGDPRAAQEAARALVRRYEAAGEQKLVLFALVVCVAGLLFALTVALLVHRGLGLALCALPVGYAAYYALVYAALRRGMYRSWLPYVSTTLEVSVATFVCLIDQAYLGAAYALTSSPPAIYYLAVAGTAVRFRTKLSLYAGLLAAAETAGVYWLLAGRLSAELVAILPSLAPEVYLQRSGYLVLAGLLAAGVAAAARKQVQNTVLEMVRRHELRRMFGRYVSAAVADKILRGELTTEGEERTVTVLCSDVRGFTPFAAAHQPREVVRFLNALFEAQCEIVYRHGGQVDKFLGDGMLAVFGAPFLLEDHAVRAAQAALEIASLRDGAFADGPADLRLGVALHSGPVVMGNVGSQERTEYTAIGDTVNVAFRLEGLNRRFGTEVLVTESTWQQIADRAEGVEMPPTKVRGIEGELRTYELRSVADA